jgi:2-succinyl-6-hydroxy-2,4-cyclohexadiene-1-carboxylate synthase
MSADSAVPWGDGIAARVRPGAGEKVLWIHGYTFDSSIWHTLWARLPDRHHIGIDLPGHGASEPLRVGETLPALARRIAALAQAEGVRHLVGLSFGGMVALQVAAEAPDAFATLILGSPGLGGGPEEPHAQLRNVELARLYRERGPGPWLTELWMQAPPDIFTGAAAHPALWDELRAVVDRHAWAELANAGMQALVNYRQPEKDLRRIRAATLILIGERDMDVFKRIGELIRRAIPAGRRSYVPDAGHLGMLENPAAVQPMMETHWNAHGSQAEPAPALTG